jgi:hypothetical protein
MEAIFIVATGPRHHYFGNDTGRRSLRVLRLSKMPRKSGGVFSSLSRLLKEKAIRRNSKPC